LNQALAIKLQSIRKLSKSNLQLALQSCHQLLEKHKDHEELLILLARLSRLSGHFTESEKWLQHALSLNINNDLVHNEVGQVLLQQASYKLAAATFEAASKIAPENPEYYFNRAYAQQQNGEFNAAIKSYESSISLNIKNPVEAIAQIAQLYVHLGNRKEALIAIKKGKDLKKQNHSGLYFAEGMLAAEQGLQEEAVVAFRKTVELDETATGAVIELFRARLFNQKDDPDINLAKQKLSKSVDPLTREQLSYALGKALDECGDYEKAFEYFDVANRLKASRTPKFNVNKHRSKIGQLIRRNWSSPTANTHTGPSPIFILGMPRSGTSLIEQIISSHPKVYGAGELDYFANIDKLIPDFPFHKPLTSEKLDKIDNDYSKLLRSISMGETFVTDKYPANFLHIGLIQQLFPNCRIIHCQRNAVDTCLSIFFQDFPQGNVWTNSLVSIAEYYNQYKRLMAHWCTLFPDQILNIQYEKLVTDQKSTTLRILNHCDLTWHDDCLDFSKNMRKVTTLSNWQIRRKVYRSSLNRKDHYLPWIEPLLSHLQ